MEVPYENPCPARRRRRLVHPQPLDPPPPRRADLTRRQLHPSRAEGKKGRQQTQIGKTPRSGQFRALQRATNQDRPLMQKREAPMRVRLSLLFLLPIPQTCPDRPWNTYWFTHQPPPAIDARLCARVMTKKPAQKGGSLRLERTGERRPRDRQSGGGQTAPHGAPPAGPCSGSAPDRHRRRSYSPVGRPGRRHAF